MYVHNDKPVKVLTQLGVKVVRINGKKIPLSHNNVCFLECIEGIAEKITAFCNICKSTEVSGVQRCTK